MCHNVSWCTHEDVLNEVQHVFPPGDGSLLSGLGAAGVRHLQVHLLSRIHGVGCDPFPELPDAETDLWHYDRSRLASCLWALLGKMANEGVTSPGAAYAYFVLNTVDGTVVPARQDTESRRSVAVLSTLVVVLLIGLAVASTSK